MPPMLPPSCELPRACRHSEIAKEGLRLMEHGADVRSTDPLMFQALGDYYKQMGMADKATAALQRSKQLAVPN